MGARNKIKVWGLAAGVRTTQAAARGAYTWREYDDGDPHKEDWLVIICIIGET